jgi:hypothetical protein
MGVLHIILKVGHPTIISTQISERKILMWFLSHNIPKRNKQKNPDYILPCSCSKNLSSFRFIIKQQWTIEEISIFSNSSHLEWWAGLSNTILKGTHPRSIPDRFGLIWFRGFRGEDLNVKVYDGRTTDAKWWQKLTWPLARWAKKGMGYRFVRMLRWLYGDLRDCVIFSVYYITQRDVITTCTCMWYIHFTCILYRVEWPFVSPSVSWWFLDNNLKWI